MTHRKARAEVGGNVLSGNKKVGRTRLRYNPAVGSIGQKFEIMKISMLNALAEKGGQHSMQMLEKETKKQTTTT